MSVLEALRSWKYDKAQPTAAVRRAQSRSAVKLVLTIGAGMAAMVLIVVPLLTLEADARGGGGGGQRFINHSRRQRPAVAVPTSAFRGTGLLSSPCDKPCGYGGWWFWRRRHQQHGSYLGRIRSELA